MRGKVIERGLVLPRGVKINRSPINGGRYESLSVVFPVIIRVNRGPISRERGLAELVKTPDIKAE